MVESPEQWPWSSYRAMMGEAPVPKWLTVDGLLSQFGLVRKEARQHYRRFVLDGVGQSIWKGLRQQIYLGDEAFVERMQDKAKIEGDTLTIPQAQRRPPAPPLSDIAASHTGRNPAIVAAYATGAYCYREIAGPQLFPASIPGRSGNRHLLQKSALDCFLAGSDVEVALLRNSALDEPLQASSLIHLAEVYHRLTFNSSLTPIILLSYNYPDPNYPPIIRTSLTPTEVSPFLERPMAL